VKRVRSTPPAAAGEGFRRFEWSESETTMRRDGKERQRRSAFGAAVLFMRRAVRHAREDGLGVAFAWILRAIAPLLQRSSRDPGERAAERLLRALGYRVEARNWRSPRDPRDEADLIARTPDGRTLVIVEVKRAAGPWDALERVDTRKKEVLWRILRDFEDAAAEAGARGASQRFPRAVRSVSSIRVDLVGVRGEGRTASATRHVVGVFERSVRRGRGRPP
jgi:Holliday junction resolvase-like predicted endonuclease